MRRALVALGVSTVLVSGVGAAAFAAGATGSGGMHDRMTTMDMDAKNMGSMGMGSMPMSGAGMDAMHAQMRDAMPADMAGACDAAHTEMHPQSPQPGGAPPEGTSMAPSDHAAHHTNN